MIEKSMNRLEEGLMILLLAAMTLLTFSQVVLRYVFNSGWGWALEATTYMFGWLVLVGISYGIKVGFHIGIDAVVNLLPKRGRRIVGLITVQIGRTSCRDRVCQTCRSRWSPYHYKKKKKKTKEK